MKRIETVVVPTREMIEDERPVLKKFLSEVSPDVVVPIGKLSINEYLRREGKSMAEAIGERFVTDPYGLMGDEKVIIPLQHSSGASAWVHMGENKKLLEKALRLIKSESEG